MWRPLRRPVPSATPIPVSTRALPKNECEDLRSLRAQSRDAAISRVRCVTPYRDETVETQHGVQRTFAPIRTTSPSVARERASPRSAPGMVERRRQPRALSAFTVAGHNSRHRKRSARCLSNDITVRERPALLRRGEKRDRFEWLPSRHVLVSLTRPTIRRSPGARLAARPSEMSRRLDVDRRGGHARTTR